MVEPHALARVDELSMQINRLHVSYLQADESPQKIEQRTKLEYYIRKYLCVIAHERKFIYPETAEILRRSVELKKNFSAYRASTGWNAIARYAANLVAQPWRKEFTVIKTFSGFYIHDIEENLVDAEHLLDCMGYKRVDHSSLVLELPIDLDAVISVSRDAIVAFVECQIIKEIWEGIYPQFECSWSEILSFRESHTGSPESAVKSLAYHYHQNCFHQQQMLSSGALQDQINSSLRFHPHPSAQSNYVYGQTLSPQMDVAYYGYPSYPPCVAPPQPRYACVMNPQHIVGYPVSPVNYHQQIKSPVELLPVNGFHYQHSHQSLPPSSLHNGFVLPQQSVSVPHNYGCIVPTGQLIELDSNSSSTLSPHLPRIASGHTDDTKSLKMRNGNATISGERGGSMYGEGGISKQDNKVNRPSTLEDLKPRRNGLHVDHTSSVARESSYCLPDKQASAKPSQRLGSKKVAPMQDGTGTWESWDYVYRNLESQGYNKDVGERGDILYNSTTLPQKGSVASAGSSPNANSNLAHNSRNVHDAEVSMSSDQLTQLSHLTDGIQSMRMNFDASTNGRGLDIVDSRNCVRESRSNPVKDTAGIKSLSVSSKPPQRENKRGLDVSLIPKQGKESSLEPGNFWECVFCTYHNKSERLVCEMCGKSRQPGNEDKPLISGGRECPKCTLVNARGVVACEACHESLKNSPTYI